MTIRCKAFLDHGVLRPQTPLPFADGAEVEVIVSSSADLAASSAATILAEIAALPTEGGDEPFAGREHDKILYRDK